MTGLQNQCVLYRQIGTGTPEVFLDPNKFSKDGTTSLAGIRFHQRRQLGRVPNLGRRLRLAQGYCDEDGRQKSIVGDTLKDVKFSGLAWRGNDGFYYSSYDKPKAAASWPA